MDTHQITIKLAADIADLLSKMRIAEQVVGGTVDKIKSSFGGMLATLGAGISIAGLAVFVKGAIDAADETSKLAQKVGVAVHEVAGLQLAFRQAGAGDAFSTSMAKMSKSVADGSKAFEAMGISTRNSDGSLRSSRVLLGEVSDKFAGYADGAAKSALAQEIFGKAGADLIPLLNAGAQSLDDYDAMALKLGLTLSKETGAQAEKFNDTIDLMGQATQGMSRQIAAQLLPTLNGLAGSFFDTMTSGDKLKKTAEFLASAMKILYISGLGVIEVFSTVGKTLGGVSSAVVAALSGDFKGAAGILSEMKTDIGAGWKDTLKQIQTAWTATGSVSVDTMAATQRAAKDAAPVLADLAKRNKAAADAAAAALKAQESFVKSLEKESDKLQLTTTQAKLKEAALLGITGKTLEHVTAILKENDAFKSSIEAAKANTKAVDDLFDAQEKLRLANEDQIKTGRTMLDQIEFETSLIAMNADQRALATLERDLETKGIVKGTQAYDAYIEKLREATATKGIAQASKKVNDEQVADWKKTIDQYDDIFRTGFSGMVNSGKGTWKSFTTSLATTFKTSVVDQIYKSFAQPFVVKFVASMLGITGAGVAQAGQAASTGSSLMSAASMAGSIYNAGAATLGGLSSGATSLAGIMTATGSQVATAVSYGTAIGSTQTAMLAAQEAGMGLAGSMGTLGTALAAVPVWGWAALAGLAVLGMSGNRYTSTQSTGYASRKYGADGSLLSSSTDANGIGEAGGVLDSIYKSIAGVQASLGATGGASITYNSNTGRESADPQFYLRTGSYDSGEIQKNDANVSLAISRVILTAMQDSTLPKYLEGAFDGMVAGSMSQKQITAAISGGQALKTFNDQLLALPFPKLADLSFAATQKLIGFSGGLDQLKTNLGGFYQNFFTAEEQRAQSITNTEKAFAAIGQVMPTLDEGARAAYKSMVLKAEAELDGTDATAKAYTALLALQGPMNQLAPTFDSIAQAAVDAVAKMQAAVQSAQAVSVQMGITTAYAVAQQAASGAYAAALKAAPGLVGYTERDIVSYAADPSKRGELDSATWGVIDTLVTAIGAWDTAQTAERDRLTSSSGAATSSSGAATSGTSAADAASSAAQLLNDKLAMQARLFELTGDKASAAAILEQQHILALAALDPSLRGFQEQIWSLEKAATLAADNVKTLKDALDLATTAANAAMSQLTAAVDAQKKTLTDAYTAQSDSIQASLDTVGTSIGKLKSLSGSLKSTLDGLRISGSDAAYRTSAQAQISAALAAARSGGGLPLDGQLDSALRTVSQPSEQLFASFTDYARDFYRTANDISALGDLTDAQLSIEERTQRILTDQLATLKAGFDGEIKALDAILKSTQAQLDAANGNTTALLTLTDALLSFSTSIASLAAVRTTQGLPTTAGNTTAGLSTEQMVLNAYASIGRTGLSDSTTDVSKIDQGGFDYWVNTLGTGALNAADFQSTFLSAVSGYSGDNTSAYQSRMDLADTLLAGGIKLPGFAQGINYVPNDMTARIHEGEAIVPKAFNPFNPNAKAPSSQQSNEVLVAAIRSLEATVARQQAALDKIAKSSGSTDRILTGVTQGGTSISIKQAA